MTDEPSTPPVPESTPAQEPSLRDKVIDAIKTIYDPEIPINIYELGLIYEVRIEDKTKVHITMTLTTPNCPSAQSLPREVEQAARGVEGVESVNLELTFDPPWDKTMMSEAALFSIGLY
jgi:FeS assembly SUF system protein